MQKNASRAIATLSVAAIGLIGIVAPAQGQWVATAVGVTEYDTNETLLLLAGVSASPWGGPGLAPVFGIQGYRLSFPNNGGTTVVWSVRPSVGLRNNFRGGSAQARIGYAFTSREIETPAATVITDRRDGVVLSGQVDWWGTGGPLGAQAIAAYNFGASSFWGRGRVTTRLTRTTAGQVRAGGEVAFFHHSDFQSVAPGVVLEWHTGGPILGLGVGRKINDPGDDATYFRAEIVLPLLR